LFFHIRWMYLPIMLSGIFFGKRYGVLFGLIGGLTLGPFMPIDVTTGESQQTLNWVYRTSYFALAGFLSGIASDTAKYYIKHLKWLSLHDPFTSLPNHRALFNKLREIASEEHASNSHALIAIAFENVQEVESSFGFDACEEIIRQMANRFDKIKIQKFIYSIDRTLLAILIPTFSQETEKIFGDIIATSQVPYSYNEIQIHVDTRMGIAVIEQVLQDPEVYLKKTIASVAVAKEMEKSSTHYCAGLDDRIKENVAVLGELKNAIDTKQLSLHYQAKINIQTDNIEGVEALMRWNHPVRGNIPPMSFIPRAEKSTLIHSLTEFALGQALRQIVQWRQDDINIPVAVNISPCNLSNPCFLDCVVRLLDQYDVGPEMLELEVTEGALMIDMEKTISELRKLAQMNIAISIDDFGTGYSSLQYLHLLPVSCIKIDQLFVRRLTTDQSAVAIVEASTILAHKMGMKVIAEGIENEGIYDILDKLECDIAQGFLISRPLPADDFRKWYKVHGGRYLRAE